MSVVSGTDLGSMGVNVGAEGSQLGNGSDNIRETRANLIYPMQDSDELSIPSGAASVCVTSPCSVSNVVDPRISNVVGANITSHDHVHDEKGVTLNDALMKAIQSTATSPSQLKFLESILQQVDVKCFQQEQVRQSCSGPSIPTPNVAGSSLNLFERDDDEPQILVNGEGAWEDVEFEVALDSGSIVNVCHPDDCPGYTIGESSGSKRGQNFVVGNGGKLANLGEWNLNLGAPSERGENSVSSIFQVAKVTRPLMSVGHICDQGLHVIFDKVHAIVKDDKDVEVCRFTRGESGLYTAMMRLKAPFTRQGS